MTRAPKYKPGDRVIAAELLQLADWFAERPAKL
jgi:hypothetical protein